MQVDIEGVGLAEFPDDAKPEEITAFVNQKYGKTPAAPTPALDYDRLTSGALAFPTTGQINSPRDVALQADAIDRKYQALADGANPEQMQSQRLQELADLKTRAHAAGLPFDVLKPDEQVLAEKVEAAKLTPEEMAAFVGPKAAKILTPIERGVAGGAGGLANPENILYAPIAEPRVAAALAKPFAAAMLAQGGAEEAKAANEIARGNIAQGVEAGITAAPTVVLGAAGIRSGPRPIEPITQGPPAPGSILKMPPGAKPTGEPNARQESEPTEIHGNVRPQPRPIEPEMPAPESGAGIQPVTPKPATDEGGRVTPKPGEGGPETAGRLPPGPGEETQSPPRDLPLTPMPGERLVTIQKSDGTTYQASYGDQVWPGAGPSGEDVPMIARPLGNEWNHGILHPDEKIVEDPGAPHSAIRTPQPEIVAPEPIKSTEPTVPTAGSAPPLEEIGDRPISGPEEPATFGAKKLPLGVSKSQWDAMAKLSEHEQQAKYNTTRSKLIEAATLKWHSENSQVPSVPWHEVFEHKGKKYRVNGYNHAKRRKDGSEPFEVQEMDSKGLDAVKMRSFKSREDAEKKMGFKLQDARPPTPAAEQPEPEAVTPPPGAGGSPASPDLHPEIVEAIQKMKEPQGGSIRDWLLQPLIDKKLLTFKVTRDRTQGKTREYGSFQTTSYPAKIKWKAGPLNGEFEATVGPKNDKWVLGYIGRALEVAYDKRETPSTESPAAATAKVAEQVAEVKRTEGARPAKEIKTELVQRVEDEIDKVIQESEAVIEHRPDLSPNEWIARSKGSAAFGTIEKVGDKFKATAQRPGYDPKRATFSSIEDAQWFIKAMASEGSGKVTIHIPGDGDFTVIRGGDKFIDLWQRVRSLDTRPTTPPARTSSVGSPAKPESVIKAYGSAEKAYQITMRQAAQLEDAEARKDAEGFAREIYKFTKASDLEAQADLARSTAYEREAKMKDAQREIDRLMALKKRTAAHLKTIGQLKKDVESTKERMEFFNRSADTYEQQAAKEKLALGITPESAPSASESAIPNPQSVIPPTGQVLGFGGAIKRAIPTIAATPKQVAHLVQTMTPGLQAAANSKQGIQSLLLPTAKSPAHLRAAEMLGAKLGAMNQRQESTAHVLRPAGKLFDRLGVHNEKLPPDQNPGIQFMSDMSQGRPMTPKFQAVADLIQKLFADRIDKLDAAGAPLQTVRDNYFPGMWTRESREAFNAAMVDGHAQGVIPKDIDVNSATPQQKAWIKQRVDEMLKAGTGSDQDMLAFFTRTPLKGKESFRKQKMFDDIMDAAQFGLRPISHNPIDLIKGKLAEMDKSIMANQFFQHLKEQKELKIINPYEETPQGWVRLNDKYGTIYGPPTVTVTEHIDKGVYEGLLNFASSLGIRHERSMKFPPGPGTRALGLSYQGQDFVRTRFATETSVLAHEIGHQIDHKYDLWNAITRGERGTERKSLVQKDLRTIADMTGSRGGNPRSKVEKIAQMVEAYVHSPDQMRTQAPTVFTLFDQFIRSKADLKSLADIRPGIELKKLTSEKYVGLPIKGYRIVPEAVGDVVNNYLSSSLYNNKYFGNVYKAWMQVANALNQTQLGLGSAFHAGFTTADVQISAGANLIKDLYGLVRGNRSLSQLGETARNWTVASLRTSFTGNKVLNAWRRPDGVLDPRIAQVVKATELAGGGYTMEHGLQTEQTTQMVRDWFSGHPTKAALRSPIAVTELMAKPIMSLLVPRQKAGVFSEMAWRIIEQNPGKDLEELTPQFRQAWNRDDARLGQVRYNRLFANNTAKNIVQALVRAPGWTGGTIAEIGGAFPDTYKFFKEWVDTGKPPQNIPDRVAYTMSLLMTVGVINAALTYAFTGQTPQGMDYLAFRTGRKDKDGNDERFLLPTYVKDLIAYAKQPLVTLGHKTHPLLSMVNDVYQNKDFYGYEIRNPHAGAGAQAGQVAKYVVKSFEPFWTRGERKMMEAGASPARAVAPLIGVMPAPGYVTRSKMQSEISELYHLRSGERLKPYESREVDEEKRTAHDSSNMDVYMFKHLPKTDKEALRQKMTPEELDRYGR